MYPMPGKVRRGHHVGSLGLELWLLVSYFVGARDKTWVLFKGSKCS